MRKIITTAAVAAAALFVTASPASAADLVERDSVDSTSVRNGSLYQQDIHPNVVNFFRTPRAAGVWQTSLNDGIVVESKLSTAVRAKLNQTGADGEDGADGAPGVSGYEVIAKEVVLPAAGSVAVTASCPDGKVPVGGGYKSDRSEGVNVFHNMAGGLTETEAGTWTATGWDVKATNSGDTKTNVSAFVTCAAVG